MISVIAALTLPTLMNSTNEKEIVARFKKNNVNLNEAIGRAIAKYGPIDTWFVGITDVKGRSEHVAKRMCEFLQVEKDCGATISGCFTSGAIKYINADGIYDPESNANNYRVVLSDGASLAFECYNVEKPQVYIDIDCPKKGRRTMGIDSFVLLFGKNRVTVGSDVDYSAAGANCRNAVLSLTYAGWILRYDNADYINCEVTESNPTCN